jgi:hypothetical protein
VKKYDAATRRALGEPRVRRFGFRLDSVKTWQPVVPAIFFAQAAELERIEKLTEDLGAFLMDLARNEQVTPSRHTNPAIKTQIEWWTASNKRRLSPRDAATADQNFFAGLKNASTADLVAARSRLTYDYFQRALAEQQQERREITEVFDQILQEMRKAR